MGGQTERVTAEEPFGRQPQLNNWSRRREGGAPTRKDCDKERSRGSDDKQAQTFKQPPNSSNQQHFSSPACLLPSSSFMMVLVFCWVSLFSIFCVVLLSFSRISFLSNSRFLCWGLWRASRRVTGSVEIFCSSMHMFRDTKLAAASLKDVTFS